MSYRATVLRFSHDVTIKVYSATSCRKFCFIDFRAESKGKGEKLQLADTYYARINTIRYRIITRLAQVHTLYFFMLEKSLIKLM